MGTRLYPKTDDVTLIEMLAGVPEGTSERLKDFERLWDAKEEHEHVDGYDRHCALVEETDLHTLHNFLLYGWGKVKSYLCKDCCGESTKGMARTILLKQGVDEDLIDKVVASGGVWWG